MKAKLIFLIALAALVAIAVKFNHVSMTEEERQTAEEASRLKPAASLDPGRVVTIVTKRGTIKFVLYEKAMPITTANFVKLASSGFYNGLIFHRVQPIVIQGGDPQGTGRGGSGTKIALETVQGLTFGNAYMVGMARGNDPNSATSQFFLNKLPFIDWDGSYACFGRVFEGQKVVDKIKKGDVMQKVTVANPTPAELAEIKKLR